MSSESQSNFPAHRFSIAPMLDWTDRHCRYFLRQLSRHTLLYTEMVTTGAIIHGKGDYLAYSEEEHPVALQLGGSDPAALAQCAKLAEARGYFAGKGNEQQAEAVAVESWFEKAMARICVPFLSTSEIGRILKGSDLWMDSDEIAHRLTRIRRAQQKAKAPTKTGDKKSKTEAPSNEKT